MEKSNNSIYDYNQKIDAINQCEKDVGILLDLLKEKQKEMDKIYQLIKDKETIFETLKKEAEEIKKSKEYRLDLIQQSQIVCKDNLMRMQEFIIYKQLIFCQE